MAVYTVQLGELKETGFPIFGTYPIFDETYRPILEKKIIDHYYMDEIGLETPAMFAHFLAARLNEIMPYYNKLYWSEEIAKDIQPLITYNLKETYTAKNDGQTEGGGQSKFNNFDTNDNRNLFLDTPNGKIEGNLEDYATNITDNSSKAAGYGTGEQTNKSIMATTEEYIKKTIGNTGATSDARLIMDLRKSFIRIDADIIKELSDLFMRIY